MIVADADVIAAWWINGPRTAAALRARRRDSDWIVPPLWRSEFRSVLRQYLVRGVIGYAEAVWLSEKAERAMMDRERPVDSAAVLKLVERTRHSS